MKKSIYNKTGTRQLIDSGFKEFDRQTNCISTGNCLFNTQVSSFIRPWSLRECNGYTFPEGQLMNYDLKQFHRFAIPEWIERVIRNKDRTDNVILYMFHTTSRDGYVRPFGWVLTTRGHDLIDSCVVRERNQRYCKRRFALDEAIKYITN